MLDRSKPKLDLRLTWLCLLYICLCCWRNSTYSLYVNELKDTCWHASINDQRWIVHSDYTTYLFDFIKHFFQTRLIMEPVFFSKMLLCKLLRDNKNCKVESEFLLNTLQYLPSNILHCGVHLLNHPWSTLMFLHHTHYSRVIYHKRTGGVLNTSLLTGKHAYRRLKGLHSHTESFYLTSKCVITYKWIQSAGYTTRPAEHSPACVRF